MAQEHDLIAATLVLVWTKRAADERLHVERVEEFGGDQLSHDEFRFPAARQREPGTGVRAERVERARFTLNVEEVLGADARRERWLNHEQARGFGVWERLKQDRVDDGEHRGVGADA